MRKHLENDENEDNENYDHGSDNDEDDDNIYEDEIEDIMENIDGMCMIAMMIMIQMRTK
ncbi:5014_t:CDS:2 [Funneliformis geosporum]|nr:5014_t:CDS:2 [Funneliformis geosporum]